MSVVALPRGRWLRRPRLQIAGRRLIPQRVAFFAGAVLVVSILVLGIVSLQAVLSETSFEMRELSRKATQLQSEYSRLKLQVAELSSPERVAREARSLGLTIPTRIRTLSVALPPASERRQPLSVGPTLSSNGELEERS
ncbi:MAG TPA: cell division protein FtsL [Actinomycetota bacterium]|nr:cell division protein FtsL [Actinomycetota bacterium]